MRARSIPTFLFVLGLMAAPVAAAAMPLPANAVVQTRASHVDPVEQPVPADEQTREYEQREQKAKQLEEFSGSGSVIYISTGAAILIGVILLLILL